MAIGRIPLPGLPGKALADNSQELLKQMLQKKAQEDKLQQEYFANDQLNQYRNATLGLEREKFNADQSIKPLKVDLLKAQIDAAKKGLGGYRGLGTGAREELFFQSLVSKDNPGLNEDQIWEASNAIREGRNTLSDGTPINLSAGTKQSADRLMKGTTTSQQINQSINSLKGEKEIDILSKFANEGLAPYGNTIAGYYPQQIMDTFKKDNASQNRLGDFIASQTLQYEIAQLRNRIARGQPGITSTKLMVDESMQNIKAKYPKLSSVARLRASKRLDEGIRAALNAAQSIGVGASGANAQLGNTKSAKKWKIIDGKLVEG